MPDAPRPTVLLVEDEPLVAMVETRGLQQAGYTVVPVASGEAAIDLVRSGMQPVDVILMDINLGDGMDGTDAARELLRDHDIPIIFLSCHTDRAIVEKTEAISSYGYVVKNTGITVLDASIKMARKLHAANRTIRQKNESLSLAQEASAAGTWDWDITRGDVSWSPECLKLFGLPTDAIPSVEAWEAMLHPEDRAGARQAIERATAQGGDLVTEYRIIRRDGERRWIRTTAKTYAQNDRPLRMIGLCMDITERKRAEDALIKSEANFQEIFDNTGHPVFVVDATEDGSFSIQHLNTGQAALLAKRREDVAGRRLEELLPAENVRILVENYRRCLDGAVPMAYEESVDLPGLGRRHYLTTLVPVRNDAGRVRRIIGNAMDITDCKEQEARQAVLLRERELLLREVYHRTKNNLVSVSSLLRLQAERMDDVAAATALRETETRVRAILLAQERLSLAEDGATLPLDAYVRDIAGAIAAELAQQGDRIRFDVDADEQITVSSRLAVACGMILNELLMNAYKHAFPRNTRGRIATTLAMSGETAILLRVRDDGIGLPADLETRRAATLGLQLVAGLVAQARGTWSITPASPGTEVAITLPLDR